MHDVHCLSELVERLVIIYRPEDAATQTWPRWSAGLRTQERRRYSNMETEVDQGIKTITLYIPRAYPGGENLKGRTGDEPQVGAGGWGKICLVNP